MMLHSNDMNTYRIMNEEDGPDVTRWVHEGLLARERLELDDVAYALDAAITKLRQKGVSVSRWAALIHIGG
jgi:hypothetical protein